MHPRSLHPAQAEFMVSAPESGHWRLEPSILAALLCSRVCNDSSVHIEVLDEGRDEETKAFALDFLRKSAAQVSAKLQFAGWLRRFRIRRRSDQLSDAERPRADSSRTARPPWSGICRAY